MKTDATNRKCVQRNKLLVDIIYNKNDASNSTVLLLRVWFVINC